jgi:hypothetical protein
MVVVVVVGEVLPFSLCMMKEVVEFDYQTILEERNSVC